MASCGISERLAASRGRNSRLRSRPIRIGPARIGPARDMLGWTFDQKLERLCARIGPARDMLVRGCFLLAGLAAVLTLLSDPPSVPAQESSSASPTAPAPASSKPVETWDFSPYHLHVWLTIEPRGALPAAWHEVIEQTILDFAAPAAGVTWDLTISEPPDYLRPLLARSLETFTADHIINADLVLVVNKELNKNERLDLKRPDDVAKPGVRLGLGDPDVCRLGTRTITALGEELATPLYARTETQRSGSSVELVAQVLAGELDAAVCYRGDAKPNLDKLVLFELRGGEASRQILRHDKLLFVNVDADARGFQIQARELDGMMRHLGPLVRDTVRQPEFLAPACAQALVKAFSPIARIEERSRSEEVQAAEKEAGRRNVITARVRAGGLIQSPECVSHIEQDDVLLPIVRRNDKYGNPTVLEPVAWTFLTVHRREGAMLDCDVQSGTRGGIAAKRSARSQQIAIKAAPRPDTTTIYLESRDAAKRPMIGYEIYVKDLHGDEEMRLIGYSDWRGAFDVPPEENSPLRLLYVKNGGFVMAKLPVVPGLYRQLTVQMNDDERRLEAEAFVKGVQATVLDTVAQMKVLELRIRNQLKEGKLDEANSLLKELLTLPTRNDLARVMDQREGTLTDPNPITQKKIDLLFKETRDLMAKYIDAKLPTQLADEVQRSQRGGG